MRPQRWCRGNSWHVQKRAARTMLPGRFSTTLKLYDRGKPCRTPCADNEAPCCRENERMVIRFRTGGPQKLRLAVVAGLLAVGVSTRAEQAPAPQLFVTSVTPDANAETLTISGGNFGTRPFVTLDLIPLEIRAAIDTLIL